VTPRSLGVLIAAGVVVADQLIKSVVLRYYADTVDMPRSLGPLLDLTVRWNPGISFSFFVVNSAAGHILLLTFIMAATVLLISWLVRCRSILAGAGLGAIIGGALGNAIDRVLYGAVVDYLDLHAFGKHFFVFNFADAAINVGIALLILDVAWAWIQERGNQTVTPPGVE
jgi:signal peptidase II